MKVVADTSVLIALGAVDKLNLLQKMWKVIFIPPAVLREVVTGRSGSGEVVRAITEGWLIIGPVESNYVYHGLGSGETECLLLSQKLPADVVLMDEAKGRKIVSSKGFRVVGTIGIILTGLKLGTVTQVEISLILEEWEKINFRLSPDLIKLLKNI
jgi:predicted nucleic acid-binding protein